MGAWGHRTFDNDDASDWIEELDQSTDLFAINAALDAVASSDGGYVESPDCCKALAAAEVVAALLGRPGSDLPPAANAWVKDKPKPSPQTVKKAHAAAARGETV